MGMATHHTGRRARLSALPGTVHPSPSESRVEIVENPIFGQNPRLAAEVEISRAVVLEDTAGRGLAHQLARRIRRLRLTEYMALSAAASTSAAERSPGSTTVTPTLAPPVAPAGQAALS